MKTYLKKHRVVAFVMGVFLALATGAAAAIIVYTLTVGGSATGSLAITTTNLDALTISNNGTPPALDANTTDTPVSIKVTNNDSVQHYFNTPPTPHILVDAAHSACQTFLSISLDASASPWNASAIGPGASMSGPVKVSVGNAPPGTCNGATFTITFTGSGIVT